MQRDTPKFDEPECSAPVAKRKNKQFVLERRYVSPVRDDLLGRITSPIRQWRVFRVNMTTVIGAGRVLSRRVNELERIVVRARRAFRASSDPVDARSWLFRVEVDEDQYPEE